MNNIMNYPKTLFLTEGIFLVIIGLLMIYLSQTATIILAFALSAGLLFLGIYRMINSLMLRNELSSPFLSFMIGLLLSIIGLYLIFHPVFNVLVLTVSTIIYFIMESINSFSIAISSRGFKQIFWISIISGVIQLFLAGIILMSIPYGALWIVGMLMGINFLFVGITSIAGYNYLKTNLNLI
ncbi:MAG: DUF308 domain-containing protein [Candidatus Gastranaerophilales bacterium]|nr:DUF308 domain-containing protein [Candidatus Gastranaerophilales bacterium]